MSRGNLAMGAPIESESSALTFIRRLIRIQFARKEYSLANQCRTRGGRTAAKPTQAARKPVNWRVVLGMALVAFVVTVIVLVIVRPGGTRPSGANCDPSYPDVCIPSPPPDLNCSDIPYRNFRVLPPDPHHFDGNHNGIGCEA